MKIQKYVHVFMSIMVVASLLFTGSSQALAQGGPKGGNPPHLKQGKIKQADRLAAATNRQTQMLATGATATTMTAAASAPIAGNGYGVPDYFGSTPNWAYSPLPQGQVLSINVDAAGNGYTAPVVDIADAYSSNAANATATATFDATGAITGITVTNKGTGYIAPVVTISDSNGGTGTGAAASAVLGNFTGGIRKFVDSLNAAPGLYGLSVAVPDTCTYSNQQADCYEIHLRQYTQKMHSDLPPTTLRGYIQVKNGADVGTISYLGPTIVANRDKPVRIKFVNELPTGAGGNLFIPTDTTYMGAGMGPNAPAGAMGTDCEANPKPTWCYTENRATLHLHGGTTPWISDGTPHQWITPAGETTDYPQGVSVRDVPDVLAGDPYGCPVTPDSTTDGCQTFFYSNQQSARLMFYHDHAYGITRLNVYAGEAAGYLLTDSTEQSLFGQGAPYAAQGFGIPLVIQDKTFVDTNTIGKTDPTWAWGTGVVDPVTGYTGDLWYPHVYMPNQNPYDISGANAMGRWDYGPWFWPPFTGLQNGPLPNPYCLPTPPATGSTEANPGFYDCSQTPWEPPFIPGVPNPSGVPEGFMDTPTVNGVAYPTLDVPAGTVRFRILSVANDRFMNLSLWVADSSVTTIDGRTNTEVKMVPWNSSQNTLQPFPSWWYDGSVPNPFDDRVGGVPDPSLRGPAMIQIGTEGGFLPSPAVIKNQPVNYVMNKRDITVGNIAPNQHSLLLGPAERADILVDFSQFAGKTLILYNDSPAPVPAADPRLDYFTGDTDQTSTGGAPSTLAGFGPNTRTIMQIHVAGTDSGQPGPVDYVNASTLSQLQSALPAAFAASQDKIIRPQAAYNAVYGTSISASDSSQYVKISDTTHSFTPYGSATAALAQLQPKAIIEDFTVDYGRMNALLGNEIPKTNNTNQTSIPQGYIDPPNELLKVSKDANVQVSAAGTLADGTQLWKMTHNGVDTHVIHTHMFVMQIINRVGWDGAIRGPETNELGWKDTVRMNPLEDIIIAVRPIMLTNVPFKLPNSVRPLDVTAPLGSQIGFTNVDPNGNPITPGIVNQLVNFGWEYVYHCHILGHEENDMMRPVVVAVPPEDPSNLTAVISGSGKNAKAVVSWTNNALNATKFTLQRATNLSFTTGLLTVYTGTATTFTDPIATTTQPYFYRVFASNVVGTTAASNFTASAGGAYPIMQVDSGFSNWAGVNLPAPAAAPTNLVATLQTGPQIGLTFTDNATSEAGFHLYRSVNGGAFTLFATLAARNSTGGVTTTDTTIQPGNTYQYQVTAFNVLGDSATAPSNSVSVPMMPAVPSGFAAVRGSNGAGNTRSVILSWTDNSNNETGFTIQRATNSTFTTGLTSTTVAANTITFTATGLSRNTNYYFRIRANNGTIIFSAWVNANPFPILTAP